MCDVCCCCRLFQACLLNFQTLKATATLSAIKWQIRKSRSNIPGQQKIGFRRKVILYQTSRMFSFPLFLSFHRLVPFQPLRMNNQPLNPLKKKQTSKTKRLLLFLSFAFIFYFLFSCFFVIVIVLNFVESWCPVKGTGKRFYKRCNNKISSIKYS